MDDRQPLFPVMLRLAGKLCVVIGGGSVGQRKTRKLLDAGARVRLACLEPRPAEMGDAGLEWLQAEYAAPQLEGAVLVVAAATAEVNERVVRDAHSRGLWVNNASAGEASDLHFPATVQSGSVTLAVSTGGRAPACAPVIGRLLRRHLEEGIEDWVELVAQVRPQVQQLASDQANACWKELLRTRWIDHFRRQGYEATLEEMRRVIQGYQ